MLSKKYMKIISAMAKYTKIIRKVTKLIRKIANVKKILMQFVLFYYMIMIRNLLMKKACLCYTIN